VSTSTNRSAQVLGVEQVLGDQLDVLVQFLTVQLHDVQYTGGVLGLGLPLPLRGLLGDLSAALS